MHDPPHSSMYAFDVKHLVHTSAHLLFVILDGNIILTLFCPNTKQNVHALVGVACEISMKICRRQQPTNQRTIQLNYLQWKFVSFTFFFSFCYSRTFVDSCFASMHRLLQSTLLLYGKSLTRICPFNIASVLRWRCKKNGESKLFLFKLPYFPCAPFGAKIIIIIILQRTKKRR